MPCNIAKPYITGCWVGNPQPVRKYEYKSQPYHRVSELFIIADARCERKNANKRRNKLKRKRQQRKHR